MTTSAVTPFTGVYQPLSFDDLRRSAPSVFSTSARPGVSTQYSYVCTVQLVSLLRDEGWEPVKASEQRVRAENRRGFQLHELRFARRHDLESGSFQVGDTRPEIVLQNSHDGCSAYRIDAGLFRLVCCNGLVVADTEFAHITIRHSQANTGKFTAAAKAVAESTPRVLETVSRWQEVILSPAARIEFAQRAAALRWDETDTVRQSLQPETLLAPQRYGDQSHDLWTTYNVVEEHLLRGGDRYDAPETGRRQNRTRQVSSLTAGRTINKALWALASEFAQN